MKRFIYLVRGSISDWEDSSTWVLGYCENEKIACKWAEQLTAAVNEFKDAALEASCGSDVCAYDWSKHGGRREQMLDAIHKVDPSFEEGTEYIAEKIKALALNGWSVSFPKVRGR